MVEYKQTYANGNPTWLAQQLYGDSGQSHKPLGRNILSGGTVYELPLPAGAEMMAWSGAPVYGHADWLGSIRLNSTTGRTVNSDVAFAPFGEVYNSPTRFMYEFAGLNNNLTDNVWDADARRYHAKEGRWLSPDPLGLGAANPADPQTWNRYAYVLNNPLSFTDPTGLQDCSHNPGGPGGNGPCYYRSDERYYINGIRVLPSTAFDVIRVGSNTGSAVINNKGTIRQDPDNGEWEELLGWHMERRAVFAGRDENGEAIFREQDMAVGIWEPIPDPNQPSWWGAFFSNLFSWQNAKQAQIDAWNKGYYKCLGKKTAGGATAPVVTHAVGVAATKATESGASKIAGAYYHFTDGRFTAWGKYSRVLVPNLAPKIATAAKVLDVAGWAYFDYELANAISECSDVLQ
jgi:RHS repeat-associated protein